MTRTKQKLLSFVFLVNVIFVMMNGIVWQQMWDRNKMFVVALTLLGSKADWQSLHPFDQLSKRLEQLDWDPRRIDEVTCKYWKSEKTFLRNQVGKDEMGLSTSCLHTAAWIVTGLLEMQTRPNNPYVGIYRLPKNSDLVVYNNTQRPRSTLAAPVIKSLRSFIDSRPVDEPILLQVDMYQKKNQTLYNTYDDHHFAIHIYDGQVNLYQGWQDAFNLIDWMREPGSFKLRYPMPVDTFLAHFEKFLIYTDEDDERRERLNSTWAIFGITETFVYGNKEVLDPVVRELRHPWVVPLITHWPSASAGPSPRLRPSRQ